MKYDKWSEQLQSIFAGRPDEKALLEDARDIVADPVLSVWEKGQLLPCFLGYPDLAEGSIVEDVAQLGASIESPDMASKEEAEDMLGEVRQLLAVSIDQQSQTV